MNEIFDVLNNSRTDGKFDRKFINMYAQTKNVDSDKLYEAILEKAEAIEGVHEVNENTSEEEYRFAEYKILSKSSGNDAQEFYSVNHPISE